MQCCKVYFAYIIWPSQAKEYEIFGQNSLGLKEDPWSIIGECAPNFAPLWVRI